MNFILISLLTIHQECPIITLTVKGTHQRADKAGPIELARLATNISISEY